MKKMLGFIAVLALIAVSCGPSAKQLEEKRVNDSIAKADSICCAQQKADSIACADSVAKFEVKEVK